jgi:hypothetical protein
MFTTKRLLPGVMVLGLSVLGVTSTACATGYAYGGGQYGRYDNGNYYREIERRAYDYGFRDGLKAGEKDGRRNNRFDPRRHGDWRDGDDGFRREYRDRELYRRNFRVGFEAGYAQSFRQYDRGGYRRY